MSESAVKTAKRLVKRALLAHEDAYLSLLDLRNTPTQGMTRSPAERMLNRRTKTLLPISETTAAEIEPFCTPRKGYDQRQAVIVLYC